MLNRAFGVAQSVRDPLEIIPKRGIEQSYELATKVTTTKKYRYSLKMAGRPRLTREQNLDSASRHHRPKDKPQYERDIMAAPLGAPEPPLWLTPEALDIWEEIVPLLAGVPELLSIVDGALLEDYCEVEAQKRQIQQAMNEGADAAAKKAKPADKAIARGEVLLRYQNHLDKLRMRANSLRRELGLTPSSRSALKVGSIKRSNSEELAKGSALDEAFERMGMRPV